MIHLREVAFKPGVKRPEAYPFNIPLFKKFRALKLTGPVTFLVGENGSGKSTLLEAIAAGVGSVTVGGEDVGRDPSLAPARALAAQLKFVWTKKTARGFFLRAEDFFNFARRVNRTADELDEMADEFGTYLKGYALRLAQGVVRGQR
ncbi:MAG TPA: AAA family ATPase, partial [Pyrinomonadaceae bacterium]|nr:AAA family ATPase [Pyrinomonadaceae bacterium]